MIAAAVQYDRSVIADSQRILVGKRDLADQNPSETVRTYFPPMKLRYSGGKQLVQRTSSITKVVRSVANLI